MKLHRNRPSKAAARGFTMIEALVAMLIFVFGVLGVVGLQASMTKAQTGAKFRADAAFLANELFGVMRSDSLLNIPSYETAPCAGYGKCSDWLNKVGLALPDGDAEIDVEEIGANPADPQRVVTITITWTQPNEGTHTYTTVSAVQP